MDPIQVPRISNWVPRIRENYHRVHKIKENRNHRNQVPTDPNRVPNISIEKNLALYLIFANYPLANHKENSIDGTENACILSEKAFPHFSKILSKH